MAKERKVDKLAGKRSFLDKLRKRRIEQEQRLKEITSSSTTPDKLKKVK
jgi:hypothetical protein